MHKGKGHISTHIGIIPQCPHCHLRYLKLYLTSQPYKYRSSFCYTNSIALRSTPMSSNYDCYATRRLPITLLVNCEHQRKSPCPTNLISMRMPHIGQYPLCIFKRAAGLRNKDLAKRLCHSSTHAYVTANIHVAIVLNQGSYVFGLLKNKILNIHLLLLLSRKGCVHLELGAQLSGICL
jgi:hypothetical protein